MRPERSVARTGWWITDVAADRLSRALVMGAGEAERGAALLGPDGARLVTQIVVDPEPGDPVGYRHSDALGERLDRLRERRPDLAYRGTAHSHPEDLAEPSRQDRRAFEAVLAANGALLEALFPIVVPRPPTRLSTVHAEWGSAHLLTLAGGCLAGYGCRLTDHGVDLRATRLRLLPVREVVHRLCAGTGRRPREAGVVVEERTGELWLRHRLLRSDDDPAGRTRCGDERDGVIDVLISTVRTDLAPLVSFGGRPFRPMAGDMP